MSVQSNQIENLLVEVMKLQESIKNAQAVLKHYRIQSPELTLLKKTKKELTEQIEQEKARIEDEFLADPDFETARNDELTHKNDLKEKNALLRKLLSELNPAETLSNYEYNINGEALRLQVEKTAKVFINGKEQK
ncbi:hypothetical protein IPJ72_03500 [Candidatus Peregrinibacteria bacterium]|nr:MAG: hypothetical protein IPJ72_03500 [Candidatus Peregrinibacteria bacterium]